MRSESVKCDRSVFRVRLVSFFTLCDIYSLSDDGPVVCESKSGDGLVFTGFRSPSVATDAHLSYILCLRDFRCLSQPSNPARRGNNFFFFFCVRLRAYYRVSGPLCPPSAAGASLRILGALYRRNQFHPDNKQHVLDTSSSRPVVFHNLLRVHFIRLKYVPRV